MALEVIPEAWIAIAAVIVVFVASLIISLCCRKRYSPEEKHRKKHLAVMWVSIILWILAFIFLAWSWYWTINNTQGTTRTMFNWLFGASLLFILLWVVMFFICCSLSSATIMLVFLVITTVAIAVQAGVIGNYWIMVYEILFIIFLAFVTIGNCLLHKYMGHHTLEHHEHENTIEVKQVEKVEKIDTLRF